MVFNRLFLKVRDALVPDFGALITAGMLVATGACAVLINSNAKLRSSETTEWRRYEHLAQLQKFRENVRDADASVVAHLLRNDPDAKVNYRESVRIAHSRLEAVKRIAFTPDQRNMAEHLGVDFTSMLGLTNKYMDSTSTGLASADAYQTDVRLRRLLSDLNSKTDQLTSEDEALLAGDRARVSKWFGQVQLSFFLTLLCGSLMFVVTAWRLKSESKMRIRAETLQAKVRHRLATAHDLIERLGRKGAMNRVLEREAFIDLTDREFDRARRDNEALSLVTFDVDGATQIADHIGHQAADRLFAGLAKMLLNVVRTGDVVGRLAPDRMAVILPGLDLESSNRVADRLRKAIADADWNGIKVTLSAGVAEADPKRTAVEMLERSERALLFAKISGNTVQPIRAHLPIAA